MLQLPVRDFGLVHVNILSDCRVETRRSPRSGIVQNGGLSVYATTGRRCSVEGGRDEEVRPVNSESDALFSDGDTFVASMTTGDDPNTTDLR